ncbi:polysaccharide pyruvyl transferase family protein [Hallella absiana]|uniref:polysaccharide pyruvyl transferase family protein n=1 Tax=Hallella absiana TaxID=2925336 RepID=UPI0021C86094|nr:polysaccharide pyruvyl transferase family protein [Hallella absiana]
MRIGILTLPPHANYGGILQAYAMQTVLERMGHDVVVFNKPIKKQVLPFPMSFLHYIVRFIKKYIFRKANVYVFKEQKIYKFQKVNTLYTDAFVNKHLHNKFVDTLGYIKNEYDAIIVGSDQVWRKIYFNGSWEKSNPDDAYLAFTNDWNIKRIAYAASFGVDYIELDDTDILKCKDAIQRFKAVSVREKTGVDICKKHFNVDAKWVADPTLLLDVSDYLTLAKDSNSLFTGKYILKYALDEAEEIYGLAHKLEEQKGFPMKELKTHEKDSLSEISNCTRRPVEEWLYAFAHAAYILTDSFHGTVFSILFHKQFTVIANKERGISRFTSLLSMFGLADRLIFSPNEYRQLPDIDYDKVDIRLEQRRSEALDFLSEALK